VDNMSSDIRVSLEGSSGYLSLKWPTYPDESKLTEASNVKDISLKNSNGEVIVAASGTSLFSFSKLYGPIKYMADISVSGSHNDNVHISSDNNEASANLNVSPGDKVHVEMYYAYENGDFKSNKVSSDETVSSTFTLPAYGSSQGTVQDWCSRFGFVDFRTEITTDPGKANTFTITDSSGISYSPGSTVTLSNSSQRISIVYYTEAEATIEIRDSYTEDNKKLTLVATPDGGSTFSYWDYPTDISGISIEPSGNSIKISVDGNATPSSQFTVTANSSRTSKTVTIYVSEALTLSYS
nr:hypothetical protein [Erysipelotrichaceae bacterium]